MMKTASTLFVMFLLFTLGCAFQAKPPVDRMSVEPGSSVSFRGNRLPLLGTPISVGKPLPSVPLVDAMTTKDVDLGNERGKVLFLSIVPIQIVPEIAHLPDMERAFMMAEQLAEEK
jgi:hypothetical protein